jgi:hypothetical protein
MGSPKTKGKDAVITTGITPPLYHAGPGEIIKRQNPLPRETERLGTETRAELLAISVTGHC